MYYPDDIIEEVRLQNDIVDVISQYVKLQKRGSNHLGLCPFHNEKTPSFSVSQEKQMYYCFGCGAGGNVLTFVMQYENQSFQEAVKNLAQRAGIALPEAEYSAEAKAKADKKQLLLELNKLAAKYFYIQLRNENGQAAHKYLLGRELSEETIKKFGLGFASKYSDDLYRFLKAKGYSDEVLKDSGLVTIDEKRGGSDKFWNRVMFPIMDTNNRVIGFGGRVMGEGIPKYLNSPETKIFDKSRNLYGLNFAKLSREPYLLICEGYMDVIALHQAGITNAAASLGTAFTSGHASLLKRYTKEVILTYDSDEAGIKAALRAIPICKDSGLSVKVLNMEPYKDPDEFIKSLGVEKFRERILQAENSFFYEIRILENRFNLKNPDEKTAFIHEIAKKLLNFTEEIERTNYLEAIAEKYHISMENLKKLVGQYGMQMGGMLPPPKPKKSFGRKTDKESGILYSQKLLLTWLIENQGLYDKVKAYIKPEDFTDQLYQSVALMLYEQFEEGTVNPAKIINHFTEEEEQKEIAALFNAKLARVETKEEMEKALSETLLKIKQHSVESTAKDMEPADMQGMLRLVEMRRQMEALKRLHISID